MSSTDAAIKVEGLGKRYQIGAAGSRARYRTVRESVTAAAAAPFRRLRGGRRAGAAARPAETDLWALRDVSFEVPRGQAVGIIGRNGAGKSTLLKILSRITAPTVGSVELTGRVGSLLEVGTGFHPELTGRENIYLNGAILGMSRADIRRRFDEIVAFAEVERFLDTPVKRYSSGMYMRLAFAVAAHLEPDVLIVDEVLAVGDAAFQKKCLGKMGDVATKEGRTVLFVSHQLGAVAELCSRAIELDSGTVACQGSADEVINHYLAKMTVVSSEEGFVAEAGSDKDMAVVRAQAFGPDKTPSASFGHDKPVTIEILCRVSRWVPDTVMGFYVRDHRGRKVFTTINEQWPIADPGPGDLRMRTTIPARFLVPGQYQFTFAISVPRGRVVDWVDDVMPIQIADAGSEFAMYEGGDYGCVFSPCGWSRIDPPADGE